MQACANRLIIDFCKCMPVMYSLISYKYIMLCGIESEPRTYILFLADTYNRLAGDDVASETSRNVVRRERKLSRPA